MKEITNIIEKDRVIITIEEYLPTNKALLLAREKGVLGRLEIQHTLRDKEKAVTYSIYYINEKNKIVCALYL